MKLGSLYNWASRLLKKGPEKALKASVLDNMGLDVLKFMSK
jgi:hypothetical protein